MTDEPQIGFWHPMFIDEPDRSTARIAHYVSLIGPFLDTYSGLTVDAYWQLTETEHNAMTHWLYASGVLADPSTPGDGGTAASPVPRSPSPSPTKPPVEVSPQEPAIAGP